MKEFFHAGLRHDSEVYGLIADWIPAQAMAQGEELQWGRARQGLIPDFKLQIPTPEGPPRRT